MQGTPAKAEHDRMHHIMVKNRAVGDFSLPPGTLCINQIVVHNLHSSIPNVVHSLYPQHLILGLELFCDAFTGRHLLYQLKKHSFSLFVQIGKISVQRAGGQQLRVQRLAVLPEIPQMPLTPSADGPLFFSGQPQTGNEIIALQLILKSVLFVVDVFFHDVILQI